MSDALFPLSESFQEMPVFIVGTRDRHWLKSTSMSKQNIPTEGLSRHIKYFRLVHGPNSSGEIVFFNIPGEAVNVCIFKDLFRHEESQCLQ